MPRLVMALGGGGEREMALRPDFMPPSDVDPRASRLFDELRAPVCRYVISLGLSPHDADEVAQETFLRLHRHLAERGARDADNLRGWIFRVAQNLAHDQRRRAVPRATDNLDDSTEARQAVDTQAGPEQQLLQDERLARVHAAMRLLPPRQQQCLRLRAEGLRYREIAEVLGVGISTVAESIHQALGRLGKAVQ
jgi:RNA polymerase sigma-70 factor, ECF subfamily